MSPDIYNLISSQTDYASAVAVLDNIFIKEKNESYSRHCLLSRIQKPDESIDQYMIALQTLAKECKFEAVTAVLHREQSIRTALISGVTSNQIRQRLLEDTKDLNGTLNTALTLEQALKNSEQYVRSHVNHPTFSAKATLSNHEVGNENDNSVVASTQHYDGNNSFRFRNKKRLVTSVDMRNILGLCVLHEIQYVALVVKRDTGRKFANLLTQEDHPSMQTESMNLLQMQHIISRHYQLLHLVHWRKLSSVQR